MPHPEKISQFANARLIEAYKNDFLVIAKILKIERETAYKIIARKDNDVGQHGEWYSKFDEHMNAAAMLNVTVCFCCFICKWAGLLRNLSGRNENEKNICVIEIYSGNLFADNADNASCYLIFVNETLKFFHIHSSSICFVINQPIYR